MNDIIKFNRKGKELQIISPADVFSDTNDASKFPSCFEDGELIKVMSRFGLDESHVGNEPALINSLNLCVSGTSGIPYTDHKEYMGKTIVRINKGSGTVPNHKRPIFSAKNYNSVATLVERYGVVVDGVVVWAPWGDGIQRLILYLEAMNAAI